MIERKFVLEKIKEYQIQEFIASHLKGAGHSYTKVQRTPLGEKIVIYTSRPGLVVGRRGENIRMLTELLKTNFDLENPQIEIGEVENIYTDPKIMAEAIATSLERFGTNKFKGIAHKIMGDAIKAGAVGVEIRISGKVPSSRAKSWRFYSGYLKKCGEVVSTIVKTAYAAAKLKTGVIGIKVSVVPPGIELPDDIKISEIKEEVKDESKDE